MGYTWSQPLCSCLPLGTQGAHQLFLFQLFIFRTEFDFNHYLVNSISSPWMKGPTGEEEEEEEEE